MCCYSLRERRTFPFENEELEEGTHIRHVYQRPEEATVDPGLHHHSWMTLGGTERHLNGQCCVRRYFRRPEDRM